MWRENGEEGEMGEEAITEEQKFQYHDYVNCILSCYRNSTPCVILCLLIMWTALKLMPTLRTWFDD